MVFAFLTAILHRGVLGIVFFSCRPYFLLFYLDFYFPFFFLLLFSLLTFISLFSLDFYSIVVTFWISFNFSLFTLIYFLCSTLTLPFSIFKDFFIHNFYSILVQFQFFFDFFLFYRGHILDFFLILVCFSILSNF